MKWKNYFYFSLSLVALVLFLRGSTASAAVYFEFNPSPTSTIQNPTGGGSAHSLVFQMGQPMAATGTLGAAVLYQAWNYDLLNTACLGNGGSVYETILRYSSNAYNDGSFVSSNANNFATTIDGSTTYSMAVELNTGSYYMLSFYCATAETSNSYTASSGGSFTSTAAGGTNTGNIRYDGNPYFCLADTQAEADAACGAGGGGGSYSVSLNTPTSGSAIYSDFGNWKINISNLTPGDVIERDVQYDNNNNWTATSTGYCDQSVGHIDSATSTYIGTSTTANLQKDFNFIPPNNGGFTNPILTDGEENKIYYKTCTADLTTFATAISTGTFSFFYGSSPYAPGGSATGTIAFIKPTSTTFLYHPFNSYLLIANNGVLPPIAVGQSYPTYWVTVQSIAPDGTVKENSDWANYGPRNTPGGNLAFQIPNPFVTYNFGNATSVQISLKATLSIYQGAVLDVVTSTFNMIPTKTTDTSGNPVNPNGDPNVEIVKPEIVNGKLTGNAITTETTNLINVFTPSSTLSCVPAADWTDIGGGLAYASCRTWQLLFVAPTNAMDQLKSSLTSLENVPPFVWFFGVNTQIINASGTAAVAWTYDNAPDGPGRGTSTDVIFQSSYVHDPVLGGIMDAWFNLVLDFCVLLLLACLYIIFVPRNS